MQLTEKQFIELEKALSKSKKKSPEEIKYIRNLVNSVLDRSKLVNNKLSI